MEFYTSVEDWNYYLQSKYIKVILDMYIIHSQYKFVDLCLKEMFRIWEILTKISFVDTIDVKYILYILLSLVITVVHVYVASM